MAASSLVSYLSLLLLLLVGSCSYVWGQDYDPNWKTNKATWYGDPFGDGSHGGGACGYGPDIDQPPFSGVIASGSARIFQGGQGCGNCYELKCIVNWEYCSNETVRVVVTDSSLNIYDHDFDLSGAAFRKMANPGYEDKLEHMGIVPIVYRQVDCNYNGLDVTFRVQSDPNPNYFAVRVEYENKGALTNVEMRLTNSDNWIQMKRSWGAVWRYDGPAIYGPFSFRLTEYFWRTIVAENVIPFNYAKDGLYGSTVNY